MGRLSHRTAPSCTYFVTTKAWENRSLFRVPEIAQIVLEILARHRAAGAYLLHDFALMPDHLHLLLTPGPTTTLEKAMQLIKGGSSYEIHKRREQRLNVWQSGFQEHTIRNPRDYEIKAQYIRMNPVEAKLVTKPEEWPYGSAKGDFALDAMPETLLQGLKPLRTSSGKSELKLRPPSGKGNTERIVR
jgi:putative transposase